MDLGCGAGLIGIIALLKNSTVHFQDYVCIVYVDIVYSMLHWKIDCSWQNNFVECGSIKIYDYTKCAVELW